MVQDMVSITPDDFSEAIYLKLGCGMRQNIIKCKNRAIKTNIKL